MTGSNDKHNCKTAGNRRTGLAAAIANNQLVIGM
jgi:hypothetical protein